MFRSCIFPKDIQGVTERNERYGLYSAVFVIRARIIGTFHRPLLNANFILK
jgi:hypothetical protein